MSNNPIKMSKLRQVIKLHYQGIRKVEISRTTGLSRNTIKKYLRILLTIHSTAEENDLLCDKQPDALFCPEPVIDPPQRIVEINSFCESHDKLLRRRGMTLSKLYADYQGKYNDGCKTTQFYSMHRLWKQHVSPSMHMASIHLYLPPRCP